MPPNFEVIMKKDENLDPMSRKGKRAVPNEQWEMNLDLTPKGADTPYGAFNPRPGYERPTVYTKTNECDH